MARTVSSAQGKFPVSMSARSDTARFLRNVLWLVAGHGARLGAGLLATVIVARYLGVERFGMLSFATTFVALFGAITGAGLERLLLRDLVEHPDGQGRILGSALLLRATGAVLTIGIVLLLLPWVVEGVDARLLVVIVLAGVLLGTPGICGSYFAARLESRFVVTVSTATMWLTAAAKVALAMAGAAVFAFAAVDVIGTLLSALAVFVLFRYRSRLPLSWDRETVRSLARRASPFVLIGVLYATQLRIDQIMLNSLVGPTAVGLYAAALKPHELFLFLPGIIATTALPSLVRGRKLGSAELEDRVRLMYGGLALCAWPLVVGIFTLAPSIIEILYGSAYAAAVDPLRIHVWAMLFAFMDTGRAQWSLAEGQQQIQALLLGAAVVLKVGLNLWLIPAWGVSGASAAMVVTIASYSLLGPMFVNAGQRRQAVLMIRALLLLDARETISRLWQMRRL